MAIHLINRLPTHVLGYKSPYVKLFGHIPDYQLLRVFGCACFLFLQPYNSHKPLFYSYECIFLLGSV